MDGKRWAVYGRCWVADKRQQWESIQSESPDVAEFMLAMGAQFGRPAAVRVELVSGKVVESGTFATIRPGVDVGSLQGRRRFYGKS